MRRLIILTCLAAVVVLLASGTSLAQMKPTMAVKGIEMGMGQSNAEIELQLAMRKLWEDHIGFTRNYIISALAGLGDADAVAQRLLKNQDEIGDAINPYYGEEAGAKLSGLLRQHIMIAGEVVAAAKGGKTAEVETAEKKWHANADEIAVFLSGANPKWTKQEMTDMLYKHLELTTAEVVSRLKQDWKADLENCDMNHMHMLLFADALTAGIIKQFPEKFK